MFECKPRSHPSRVFGANIKVRAKMIGMRPCVQPLWSTWPTGRFFSIGARQHHIVLFVGVISDNVDSFEVEYLCRILIDEFAIHNTMNIAKVGPSAGPKPIVTYSLPLCNKSVPAIRFKLLPIYAKYKRYSCAG